MQLELDLRTSRFLAYTWGRYSTVPYNPSVSDLFYFIEDYLSYRRSMKRFPTTRMQNTLASTMMQIQDSIRYLEQHGTEHERLQAVILMDRLAARMREQDAELAAQEAA